LFPINIKAAAKTERILKSFYLIPEIHYPILYLHILL
jgi:hypothetical protein